MPGFTDKAEDRIKQSWFEFSMMSDSLTKRTFALIGYAFSNPLDFYILRRSGRNELSRTATRLKEQASRLPLELTGKQDLVDEVNYLSLVVKRKNFKKITAALSAISLIVTSLLIQQQMYKNKIMQLVGQAKTAANELQLGKNKFGIARYIAPAAAALGLLWGITLGPIFNMIGRACGKRGNSTSPKPFDSVSYRAEFGKLGVGVLIAASAVACNMVYGFSAAGAALQTGAMATLIPGTLAAKTIGLGALAASASIPPVAIAVAIILAVCGVFYSVAKFAKFCYHKYQERKLHYSEILTAKPNQKPTLEKNPLSYQRIKGVTGSDGSSPDYEKASPRTIPRQFGSGDSSVVNTSVFERPSC